MAEAFDRLDSDDSGYISRQNLRDFLGKDGTMELIDQLISDADVDKDGKSKSSIRAARSLSFPPFHS